MSSLALNVISSVAFENHDVNSPTEGHELSLKDALTTVMSTSISPALEGLIPWANNPLVRICLPRALQRLMLAMSEFSQYMDELIARERAQDPKDVPQNLIQTLIHANAAVDEDGRCMLADSELRGNIFLFTVGGLESTSATLTYALALLAIHPEVQKWVYEEIASLSTTDYTKTFPRLVRVRAVMVRPQLPTTHIHPHERGARSMLISRPATVRNSPLLLAVPAAPADFPQPFAALHYPYVGWYWRNHAPAEDADYA